MVQKKATKINDQLSGDYVWLYYCYFYHHGNHMLMMDAFQHVIPCTWFLQLANDGCIYLIIFWLAIFFFHQWSVKINKLIRRLLSTHAIHNLVKFMSAIIWIMGPYLESFFFFLR